jgi:magnesium chelatase subunit D
VTISRIFPFTAIVGQERMKRALVLNAINPRIGGVLIRGERGTAKSTAARALAALLPEITVVADCPFGCDPERPTTWCTNCRERAGADEELPVKRRRTRFVDLPVSATEDRVVGTLDIERAIQKGERRFEPGVLAAANRGVLYVDEVNLLDDHVVDLLLDAAAMGVNVVEREGISFSHPARFILVGTMNPEEGDLRPQLLDRFALCVDIRGIRDQRARMAIMEHNLAFEADPEGFRAEWMPREERLTEEISRARRLLPQVKYTQQNLATIAGLMAGLGVDGHRADLVILKTAQAHAARQERAYITDDDILMAAELTLPHRLKRTPLQQTEVSLHDLQERLETIQSELPSDAPGESEEGEAASEQKKNNITPEESELPPDTDVGRSEPMWQNIPDTPQGGRWWEGGQQVPIGEQFDARRLDTPLDQLTRKSAGRRSTTKTDRKRGRYVQARHSPGDPSDLAFDATLRAAAPHQKGRKATSPDGPALSLRPDDYQKKVRVRRAANLILFVVDASWSMAVAERMQATKGAIMSLLTDAYQRRDRVGLVVFQKSDAHLVLKPTNSVELAQKALADIPVGGKTPLSAGLMLAYRIIIQELRLRPELSPLMILLTDGAGNVSTTETLPPQEEANRTADLIREADVRSVVINMEHAAFDQGLAQALADRLDGPCYTLPELRADALLRTVKDELQVEI